MTVLLKLMILATVPSAPIADRFPSAIEVYACGFERDVDANYDNWPDGWARRRGKGYPHYLPIEISENSPAQGKRCLKVELNGGSAAVYSPLIDVDQLHRYVMEGIIKTEQLTRDRAFLSLTFFDENKKELAQFTSHKLRTMGQWQKVRLGPIASTSAKARLARIGVHLAAGDRADLKGRAMFDDLWLGRLPRLEVFSNRALHVYQVGEPVAVTCRLTGVEDANREVTLELLDPLGATLLSEERRLTYPRTKTLPLPPIAPSTTVKNAAGVGAVRWIPEISGPGFYRIRCTIKNSRPPRLRQELGIAVIEPEIRTRGEFGWSLPRGEEPLPMPVLAELLPQMGVHWLKYPVWFGKQQPQRAERLVRFIEQMSGSGISVVGLLNHPPPEVRKRYGNPGELSAAQLFTVDPEPWYDSLESVLLRLSMKIHRWQLGLDHDTSFAVYRDLDKRLAPVKQKFDSAGQHVELGFGWDWLFELPETRQNTWQFIALSARPPLTAAQLGTYLDDHSSASSARRWVSLEPLPREQYALEVRAKDLVERMLAAKIHGADAIVATDVFDERSGLMRADGSPGDLLLPWRTTALMLGGAEYLGALELPNHSPNHLFIQGQEATLVVWAKEPSQEVLYLGETAEQRNLWGHRKRLSAEDHRQVVPIDVLPTFVTGVHPAVARWRLAAGFADARLPSILGQAHRNAVRIKNTFPLGVRGRLRLVVPSQWHVAPQVVDFNLAAGESIERPIVITLPYHANSGSHDVRLDFEVTGDRAYQFSVYRRLQVGLGDVQLEVATRLRQDGYLVVEQRIINQSDTAVSFNSNLFVPNRRRMRGQVLRLGQGQNVQTYLLSDGEALLGKWLWIRADEIGGSRVLSRRFVAEP